MKKILKNLVDQGLVRKESGIKFDQIKKRLNRALIDLNNAKLLLSSDETGAYRMAYDAMLQAGLSLVLAHGYRPEIKNFHKTVVECNRQILGDQYGILIKKFDQMRKNRHNAIYDIATVSLSEAEESIKMAEEFIKEIKRHIKKLNPQRELLEL